ncbi:hypothetical protein BOSEA31B_10657 [Hyphomicrobiales bacterium]|nr:hypothetical protein BOSEA31B_10657 [Hyphomicrobiales bacterium]CAH1700509.1 hypothetical protein BOSEA1005_20208 [Hyphomicrobiales bacterium]CAI0344358.1 hypothetical protein BO1005MUT1_330025 [Hyphomicrobiales bacterium]
MWSKPRSPAQDIVRRSVSYRLVRPSQASHVVILRAIASHPDAPIRSVIRSAAPDTEGQRRS